MTTVIVLGASGMLGSMVVRVLAATGRYRVAATVRSSSMAAMASEIPGVEWRVLDAELANADAIAKTLGEATWAVNAIGVIKPHIHDDNAAEVECAIRVNALFPHVLAAAAAKTGCRVLQIATDCVYSGAKGRYVEADKQDALDVYGKTKSLGEVVSPNTHHLRCSIIGPEPKAHVSLLDWFRGQARGATVQGYTNHRWNGITTLHFGRLCEGAIRTGLALPAVQHVVPSGDITKCALLECFARAYNRQDVKIVPREAAAVVDRTLATTNTESNKALWAAAGYSTPPDVEAMIAELAAQEKK